MLKNISSLIFCVALLVTTGCVLNVDSDRSTRGKYWDESDVSSIRLEETSGEWVLDSFGEPTRRVQKESGSEIWRYSYREDKETEVGLIFLFRLNLESDSDQELNIEIADGVVVDYWTREY